MNPLNPDSPAQTINECLLRLMEPGLAHSKGKPDASSTKINISIRFATPFSLTIPVRVARTAAARQAPIGPEWVGIDDLFTASPFEIP